MTVAIRGVRVWDGVADTTSAGPQTIRVELGRITGIGSDEALLEDADVVEPGPGCVALPGLIDAHVHLTLDPALRDAAGQTGSSASEQLAAAGVRAAAMLRAGITTARDLGGGDHLEVALRDRIARGQMVGPRLLCAGQPLTTKGGHCHFWGGEVDSDDEIRDFVELQCDHGVDWIKVMATGGVITRGTNPADAQFAEAQLAVVCAAAATRGRKVAAHCHATEGIRRAVRAGAHTIEHCSWVGTSGFGSDFDESIAVEMGERGTVVSPTVNAGWTRFVARDGVETEFYRGMRRAFDTLRNAGVVLIASTDAGIPNVAHHDLPRALPIFAKFAGMTPVETLRSATSHAATALELEGIVGRLLPGHVADVLVVQGDPLVDLSVLEQPRMVMAAGMVVSPA
jgi:imidazolonepropionase-like amidohydrolase